MSAADPILCRCCDVRQSDVAAAMQRGARSLERVMDLTGASGGCGTCVNSLRDALLRLAEKRAADSERQDLLPF
ncbi:MAG: (2Fe-2S)-binding protein [Leptospirales bacterium]|nr:(2Fe-2S)-binding protein [Leptospirales bacterium]